jgi:putative Mg2+ transporter-C (MgtC) family protein
MGEFISWLVSLPARHPELRLDLLGELLLAAVLGGAIGWEREHAHKPAGLRTNILICMGAALIAAQIVSGIGFLGAGTIIQARGSVTGLTTAATMWVVAAIGMAVGFGADVEAVGTTVLVLIALIPLGWMEGKVEENHLRERRRKAKAPDEKLPLGREREE